MILLTSGRFISQTREKQEIKSWKQAQTDGCMNKKYINLYQPLTYMEMF